MRQTMTFLMRGMWAFAWSHRQLPVNRGQGLNIFIPLLISALLLQPLHAQPQLAPNSFSEPVVSDLSSFNLTHNSLILGRFNPDPWLDIAQLVPNFDSANTVSLHVAEGNGQGNFSDFVRYDNNFPSLPFYFIADLDNDGMDDIITNGTGSGFAIYLNKSNRSFNPVAVSNQSGGQGPVGIVFGKYNDNQYVDVFASYDASDNQFRTIVAIFEYDGSGGFRVEETAFNNFAFSLSMRNLNTDGYIDFAFSDTSFSDGDVYLSTGPGSYEMRQIEYPIGTPDVDINGDGALDLVDGSEGSLKIAFNDGRGRLGSLIDAPVGVHHNHIVDINGDGLADLIGFNSVVNRGIVIGNGQGSWSAVTRVAPEIPGGTLTGDFNDDSLPDLLIHQRRQGRYVVLLNQTDTVVADTPEIIAFEVTPMTISAGESATLSWSVRNAETVTLEPSLGLFDLEGELTLSPTQTTMYTLKAANADGTVSETVTVTVTAGRPEIELFGFSPRTVAPGQEALLNWRVAGAGSVSIEPDIGVVEPIGEIIVTPTGSEQYTLIAVNAGGEVSQTALVTVLDAPGYIDSTNYWIGANGGLVCVYPDPGADGSIGDFVYIVTFYQDCAVVQGPSIVDPAEGWPAVLTLDPESVPVGDYTIGVRRVPRDNPDLATPETITPGPAAPAATSRDRFSTDRWLLHVPRVEGGFAGQIKLVNDNRVRASILTFTGYDANGRRLGAESIEMEPGQIRYFDLFGDGPDTLFASSQDQPACIGIDEPGDLTRVFLRYLATSSSYGVWVPEMDFRSGDRTGRVFEMEARGAEAYTDGVAVLNLRQPQTVGVWVVQRDRSGMFLDETFLGEIAPGSKLLSVISNLFPYRPGAKYTIEARNGGTIQVMGLSFLGGDFFAVTPTQKLE